MHNRSQWTCFGVKDVGWSIRHIPGSRICDMADTAKVANLNHTADTGVEGSKDAEQGRYEYKDDLCSE